MGPDPMAKHSPQGGGAPRRAGTALLVLALLLVGCADFTKPRLRAGSVPHPRPLSLYSVADPQNLGTHRYQGLDAPFVERTRGLIYTDRAGLLDLAHVRMTIDWSWYHYHRARHALAEAKAPAHSDDWLVLPTSKPSRIHVQFDHAAIARARLDPAAIDELAFRIGQKLAWYAGTWHEMAQWHGYRSTGFFSELDSAFTHDDTTSHLVGLYVAEAVWRQRHEPAFDYDQAVTEALNELLAEFGATEPSATREKVLRMHGRWWDYSGTLRRHLEQWTGRGELRPWLAAEEPGGPGRWGEPMPLPQWDSGGLALDEVTRIRFEANIWEADDLAASARTDEPLICPRRHFPRIKEAVREQMIARFGPEADQP